MSEEDSMPELEGKPQPIPDPICKIHLDNYNAAHPDVICPNCGDHRHNYCEYVPKIVEMSYTDIYGEKVTKTIDIGSRHISMRPASFNADGTVKSYRGW